MEFTNDQQKVLDNIKSLFSKLQETSQLQNEENQKNLVKKPVDRKFWETLFYISGFLFPILGSYLQHYIYVIYLFFKQKH